MRLLILLLLSVAMVTPAFAQAPRKPVTPPKAVGHQATIVPILIGTVAGAVLFYSLGSVVCESRPCGGTRLRMAAGGAVMGAAVGYVIALR